MRISEIGWLPKRQNKRSYTLIELIVVVLLIGIFLAIVSPSLLDRVFEVRLTGTARQIGNTILYLHNQSAVVGKKHRLYYDLANNVYWSEKEEESEDGGEADFVELGGTLGRKAALETGVQFSDVTTPREVKANTGTCWTEFSPLGFAEKTVIHLIDEQKRVTTLTIKPFSGRTEIYDGYKE